MPRRGTAEAVKSIDTSRHESLWQGYRADWLLRHTHPTTSTEGKDYDGNLLSGGGVCAHRRRLPQRENTFFINASVTPTPSLLNRQRGKKKVMTSRTLEFSISKYRTPIDVRFSRWPGRTACQKWKSLLLSYSPFFPNKYPWQIILIHLWMIILITKENSSVATLWTMW